MIIVTSSFFLQASFPKCSLSSLNAKPAFTNSSSLKSAFKKLHFRDGLVWTEELAKLRFQIPPANNEPLFFSFYMKTFSVSIKVGCNGNARYK